jgi:hypothetical protein
VVHAWLFTQTETFLFQRRYRRLRAAGLFLKEWELCGKVMLLYVFILIISFSKKLSAHTFWPTPLY